MYLTPRKGISPVEAIYSETGGSNVTGNYYLIGVVRLKLHLNVFEKDTESLPTSIGTE